MELPDLGNSFAWIYYRGFFMGNAGELSSIIAARPTLLWQTFDAVETWTPAIQALDDGDGDSTLVTQQMVDEALGAFTAIAEEANPALAARIRIEIDTLNVETFVGMTMTEVYDQAINRVDEMIFVPVINATGY
jgi:hypothetical protein